MPAGHELQRPVDLWRAFGAATCGLIRVDAASGALLQSNLAFRELLGYPDHEIDKRPLAELLAAPPPAVDGLATAGLARDGAATDGLATDGLARDGKATDGLARGGEATDGLVLGRLPSAAPAPLPDILTSTRAVERELRRSDGSTVWLRFEPLGDPAAEDPAARLFLVFDWTERRALERELEARVAERTRALSDAARLLAAEMRRCEEAQATLLQAQKLDALGQLTGGIAHDFNNLLMAIGGSIQLVERRVDTPSVRKQLATAREAVGRASRLTAQLLAFARRQQLAPAAVRPADLFDGLGALLHQAVGEHVRVAVAVDADCWPAHVDRQQLEVALLNLAVNARDAMPDGGSLALAARNCPSDAPDRPAGLPPGDAVVIAVRDTGHGMTPDVLARVTEPFFTTKERGKGTGLGLAMVHGFLEQSGGQLAIRSEPGAGAAFELYLPRSHELVSADPPVPAAIDRQRHGGATILVVDDDQQVRPVAAALLRDLGYTVLEAADAETAFALAHAIDLLDLVLSDVVMPGADGPTLVGRLRVQRPRLPALYMTGYARQVGLRGEHVLSKPFTQAELAEAVLGALGRDREHGPARSDDGVADADRSATLAAFDGADERIFGRLRSEALRHLFRRWASLRRAERLPTLTDFDTATVPDADCLFVAEVEQNNRRAPTFRYLSVGAALADRLGRQLAGERVGGVPGPDILGALEAAYLRCARTGAPSHEYARFNLGDGAPVQFERLLVPFSEDGRGVTHLVGMAIVTDSGPTDLGLTDPGREPAPGSRG